MADTENKPAEGEQKAKRRLNMTLDSYTLFAQPRTRKDRKQLRLTFGCSNGYPNVNVETDEEGEGTQENGWLRVSSRLNGTNFGAVMSLVEMAVNQEPGWRRAVECYHTWKDGRQFEEKQHINDLVVGVDNQGLVYMSIIQSGRTTTKFVFGPTEWHNYKKEDGSPWSQKEMNHLCAKETAAGLRVAMNALIANDCMDNATQKAGLPSPSMKPQGGGDYPKKDWGNGGGQGNYQKKDWGNGGQQGGYQKKPWQGNQNGGYQKKPWNGGGGNGGGNYQNGGNGGYQKKQWDGNRNGGGGGGYQNNGGGFKKQWDNNGGGQGDGGFKKPAPSTEIDLDSFDDL